MMEDWLDLGSWNVMKFVDTVYCLYLEPFPFGDMSHDSSFV